MTPRGKKSLKHDDSAATMEKKTKRRNFSGSADDDEDNDSKSGHWTLKAWGDIPAHSIYNTTSRSQPAELFRKDLISAMKLPDSEPLSSDEYWLLSDPWKQEWEKGVQVPVNPDEIPQGIVRVLRKKDKTKDYKLPAKLLRTTHDEFFSNEIHQMSNAPALAEKMCRYDLDNTDVQWLKVFNSERHSIGLPPVQESVMENVIEEIEVECHNNMQIAIQTEAGLGIEYDEDVICDVCRSPDSEEGNEMVFCDSCDICVHQACYGITKIPAGSWLCKTCAIGIKPSCLLCPNKGGAMKTTKSPQKWAHVSCALWIPEVSIGCVDKMEPIVKISQIPASRWALVCCLCRDRCGACIQCSVKTCKTAYHVTCAFKNGLQMKAIIEDQKEEDLKLRSYCPKHSKNRDKKDGDTSDTDSDVDGRREKKKKSNRPRPKHEMNSEEKANARDKKIKQIEANFQEYVTVKDIVENLQIDTDVVDFILQYWKLKRTAGFGKPLITPKSEEIDILGREKSDNLYAKMRMFVHLRQDLERVRNLCYMVNRREKLNSAWFRLREEIFHKQLSALTDPDNISGRDCDKIIHAPHGNSIYDRIYSWDITCCVGQAKRNSENSEKVEKSEEKLELIEKSPEKLKVNGLNKNNTNKKPEVKEKQPNPYAKTYFNGRSQRRGVLGSLPEVEKSEEKKLEKVENETGSVKLNSPKKSEESVIKDEVKNSDVVSEEISVVNRRSSKRKPLVISEDDEVDGDDVDQSAKSPKIQRTQLNNAICNNHVDDATLSDKNMAVTKSIVKEFEKFFLVNDVGEIKTNDKNNNSGEIKSTRSRSDRRRCNLSPSSSSSNDDSSDRRKRRRRKKKDGRELARQESVKVRQSLFRVNDPLRGYKIPKVTSKTNCDEDISESQQIHNHCNGNLSPCKTPPRVSSDDANEDSNKSPRLIIKLKKDPNYPESPRWKRDDEAPMSSDSSPDSADKSRRLNLMNEKEKWDLGEIRQRRRKEGMQSRNKFAMRLRTSLGQQQTNCKLKKLESS